MNRFSVSWTEAKASARHSSTFWGISRSSKGATSINSEIFARTFPSLVTPYVLQTMKEAYKCKSADKARKQLRALVSWLERNGYDEAAGSLREGMEETLTVLKLALPELLRRSLATTNAIENLNGTIRRVSRNVKRWKSPSMIRRWTALGVVTAEKKFRRIKGYRNMGALVHALKRKQKSLDSDEFAA